MSAVGPELLRQKDADGCFSPDSQKRLVASEATEIAVDDLGGADKAGQMGDFAVGIAMLK